MRAEDDGQQHHDRVAASGGYSAAPGLRCRVLHLARTASQVQLQRHESRVTSCAHPLPLLQVWCARCAHRIQNRHATIRPRPKDANLRKIRAQNAGKGDRNAGKGKGEA